MWNLQNLARNNVFPKAGQHEDEQVRFMLRSALSIDGDSDLLLDVLTAMELVTKNYDDH